MPPRTKSKVESPNIMDVEDALDAETARAAAEATV